MAVGLRVIRGPDWSWGQQDGGEGSVGTVTELGDGGLSAVVQWDCAGRCRYRCGQEGKYDLRVLDVAQTGVVHAGLTCTWCDEHPLVGTVWRCVYCYDYFLCTDCYMSDKHCVDHPFHRCTTTDLKKRVRVPPRFQATKIPLMGIFPGAKVIRGPDWQWQNQDGGRGNQGHVTKVHGWKNETFRSVAVVTWSGARGHNVYRRGHHGKVDLRCVTAANKGDCYTDHLALLGYQYPDPPENEISAGDAVVARVDPDVFKFAQEGHGGWFDDMAEYIGQVGMVKSILWNNEVALVHYTDNRLLQLNIDILTQENIPIFHPGNIVRVIDDLAEVHSLQSGHGGWADDIALALGQVGRVVAVKVNYDTIVKVNGRNWVLNPKCLVPAPEETLLANDEEEQACEDLSKKQRLDTMFQAGLPDVIPTAAALGDIATLRTYLNKNPHEVNHKISDKGALHMAVIERRLLALKTVLEFNPNLNLKDETGETPLHICARTNDPQAANLLLEAGGDVNAKEYRGVTTIEMAAALGRSEVLRVLLNSPSADVDVQDGSGKTALHRAIENHDRRCVRLLLEHGASPLIRDFDKLNAPLHEAPCVKFLCGVEEILHFYPQHINLKNDSGLTPFHLAVAGDIVDIAMFLAFHPACDINTSTGDIHLTPLHTAVHEGHVAVVEKLVGLGANLDTTVGPSGGTPLHLAIARTNMSSPSNHSPRIKALQDELEEEHGKGVFSPNMVVALFLAANGANIHVKDLRGVSALSMCLLDCTSILKKYAERGDAFLGSLKGLTQTSLGPPKSVKHGARDRAHTDVHPTASQPSPPSIQRSYSSPPTEWVRTGSASGQAVSPLAGSGSGQATTPPPLAGSGGGQAVTPPPLAGSGQAVTPPLLAGSGSGQPVTPPPMAVKTGSGSGQAVTPPPGAASNGLEMKTKDAKENENVMNNLLKSTHITEKLPDILQCFLCEGPADIKLMPCGHVNMCHVDFSRCKKCPECRVAVSTHVRVCVLCRSETIGKTLEPCGHTYCSGCGCGHDYCDACRRFEGDS